MDAKLARDAAKATARALRERLRSTSPRATSSPVSRDEFEEILIADVLNLYLQDVVPTLATAKKAAGRIDRLLDWWGTMMLDEVTGAACRQ